MKRRPLWPWERRAEREAQARAWLDTPTAGYSYSISFIPYEPTMAGWTLVVPAVEYITVARA